MRRIHLLALGFVLGVGCANHHPTDPHDDALATLTIDPATSELLILNGTPATASFTATATYPDGFTRDVTSEVSFSIDTSFGSFSGNTLSMRAAGKTQVFGFWTADHTGTAQVIGRVKDIRVDPSLDPNTPDLFNGPEDAARAPAVVYPPADVVMPRNLGDFEVHWTDASTNDVFEVSLQTEFADVRIYVPGGNGDAAAGAGATWTAFLADEWLAAVGTETSVHYQVRGVDKTNPTAVGSAPVRLVKLSNEAMLGGLYYWAASSTVMDAFGIFRHDMSKPGEPAEEFMTKASSGRCVACHVLSRDGTQMAITYDGGNGNATFVDVAMKATQPEANAWNFGTYTPDGTQFLAVHAGALVVRSSADQSVLATMTSAGWVTHPDLSPDGTTLVYVRPAAPTSDWNFTGGAIYTRSYDQTTMAFGAETPLVADTNNNYYPSFSPDGKWILFTSAPANSAYNNGDASLWVVKADGSAPPVELTTANQTIGLTNSWGRWAPFAQTLGAANEQMYWVTVSSKRDFGVRLVGTARPQIWMTPFFPAQAAAGTDPSAAAFRLPFQNIESSNHIAQWTEQIVAPQ